MPFRMKETIILGFVLGIAVKSFFDVEYSLIILFITIPILFIITEEFYLRFLGKKILLRKLAIFLLFISLGMLWFLFREVPKNSNLEVSVGKDVSLIAVIDSEPEEKENFVNLIVNFSETRILLRANPFPKYCYGDKIEVVGKLEKPNNFDESFDYISYLGKDGIYYLIRNPKINLVSSGNGSFLKSLLFEIKKSFIEKTVSIFSEPQSSLLAGLLIGAKESLGGELLEKFRIVGLSHIIVLSGYNLSVIASATIGFFSYFFSLSLSSILGSISIVLFTLMVGGGPATIRAMIMALIILLAKVTGRMHEASWALVLAGLMMVVYNPKILVFDMSFQLSFLATLGLIYLSPLIKEKIKFLPENFQFRELVATTLGAQLATMPLIIYKIGEFSLVSLFANLLVVVLIPATMFFGFFSVVVGFFSVLVALPFSAITWVLLSYEIFIVESLSKLPFASVKVSPNFFFLFLFVSVLFFYGSYFFRVFLKNRELERSMVFVEGEDWEIMEVKNAK